MTVTVEGYSDDLIEVDGKAVRHAVPMLRAT